MQVVGPISGGRWWHHHWTHLSYHKWHCSNLFFLEGQRANSFCQGTPPFNRKTKGFSGIRIQDRAWARHWRLSLYQYTTATSKLHKHQKAMGWMPKRIQLDCPIPAASYPGLNIHSLDTAPNKPLHPPHDRHTHNPVWNAIQHSTLQDSLEWEWDHPTYW